MPKSPDAFRTISEVADWLGIQAHVLRFWESKFTQVKPIKRAGGRRYYRPADMLLLGGIKRMLHDDGMTIKGVQKVLREEGMNHVSSLSAPLDELTQADFDDDDATLIDAVAAEPEQPQSVVLPFEPTRAANQDNETPPALTETTPEAVVPKDPVQDQPETSTPKDASTPLEPEAPVDDAPAAPEDAVDDTPELAASTSAGEDAEPAETDAQAQDAPESPPADDTANLSDGSPDLPVSATPDPITPPEDSEPSGEQPEELPAFLRQPLTAPEPDMAAAAPSEETAQAAPAPKPRIIDVPVRIDEDDIAAEPGLLSAALRADKISPQTAKELAPLLVRLAALRDSMSSGRRPASKD